MARKKKGKRITTVEEIEVPETPETDPTAADFAEIPLNELPPDIDNIVKELGEDVTKVLLYRRVGGSKQSYVGTIDADEFSMDYIARTWGGGRYLARIVGSAGILKGQTFYIDESIKPEPKEERAKGGDLNDKLLEKLFDKLGDRAPQKDPMEIAAAMAAASAAQMQAMMAMMMPLISKMLEGGGKGSAASDLFEAIQLGLDMGGKDDGYMGVIKEVGVPLVNALERSMGAPQGPRRRLAMPPGSSPAQPEVPVALPIGNAPPWVAMLRPYVPRVLAFIQQGATPGTVAAALDLQGPRVARWLEETVVATPDFKALLLQYFPEFAPHGAWLDGFIAEFMPEEEDDPTGELHEGREGSQEPGE